MEYIDTAYVEAKAYYGNLLAGMDKEMLPLNDVEGEAESRAQLLGRSDIDVWIIKEFCAKHDFTEKAFFNKPWNFRRLMWWPGQR